MLYSPSAATSSSGESAFGQGHRAGPLHRHQHPRHARMDHAQQESTGAAAACFCISSVAAASCVCFAYWCSFCLCLSCLCWRSLFKLQLDGVIANIPLCLQSRVLGSDIQKVPLTIRGGLQKGFVSVSLTFARNSTLAYRSNNSRSPGHAVGCFSHPIYPAVSIQC